jgi:hypothetical protein
VNLGQLWETEDIGDMPKWCATLKAKIGEREQQSWIERMQRKDKLRLYRSWKSELVVEQYLRDIVEFRLRRGLTQLRSGTCDLRVEQGRWKKEELKDRVCVLCASDLLETEEHFLLDCWVYAPLRRRMLDTVNNHMGGMVEFKMSGMIGCG